MHACYIYILYIYIPVLRFALAHEGKMCRRNVLLEYLGEESNTAPAENGCCDVCSSDFELIDYQKEVLAAIHAGCPRNSKLWEVRLYQGCVVTVHQGCVIIVTPPYLSYSSPSGFMGQEATCPEDSPDSSYFINIWDWRPIQHEHGRVAEAAPSWLDNWVATENYDSGSWGESWKVNCHEHLYT